MFASKNSRETDDFQSDLNQVRLAARILEVLFRVRRSAEPDFVCSTNCVACHAPHLGKIRSAVGAHRPVQLVLPAFPGKSPNLAKVLSPLPDRAELLALEFLQKLCNEIGAIYAPGVQLIICSDGRVFSDVIGMKESDVTEYQQVITSMIEHHGLVNLSTFHLDELTEDENFQSIRHDLLAEYGTTQEALREKIRRGASLGGSPEELDANRMYRGITRFLVEDSSHSAGLSRTQKQRDCKERAIEVIRRSNAWSALIEERFPEAVRLSIHPQVCGSQKLGVRLVANESWMTPWHGVAVKTPRGFVLMKRAEAETLRAQLVTDANGRPDFFEAQI